MRLTQLLILTLCTTSALGAYAADWPQFRGPKADGVAPDLGINKDWAARPPRVLWQATLTDGGYAGPSVADGKVFIIDHAGDKDLVRAIDLQTGVDLWCFPYTDTTQNNYGFARSTPVYSEGKLYTVSRMGWLHCLDAADGKMLWRVNLISDFGGRAPQWDYSGSVLIDGEKLIVVSGGVGNVLALNKETGELIWRGGNNEIPGYATPVAATILGQKQYVIFTGAAAIGVSAESGALLWRHPWKTSYDVNAPTPIVSGNYVFLTSGYNVGCALVEITAEGPREVWRNKEIVAQFNTPVFYAGYLFGIGDPGNLVCLDTRNGVALWKQPGFEKGGVVAVDGAIIAVNGAGGDAVLVAATPSAYQELGRVRPLGGQSWTAPIVADGKLIIRNTQGIACLDLM